jgi:rhamnulokinase
MIEIGSQVEVMEKTQSFLAFDLGAKSGRVVLGHLNAGKLELREIHHFPNQPVAVGKSLYWGVLHLWDEMKRGLALAVGKQGRRWSV